VSAEGDDSEGIASTGREKMLEGLIRAGLTVTATWPIRTERSGHSTAIGTNALASSIVLAFRPKEESASTTDRHARAGARTGAAPPARTAPRTT
jgi:putative DNA methylase